MDVLTPFLCLYCLFKNVNGGLLHEVRIKVETVTKRENEEKSISQAIPGGAHS